MTYQTSRIIYSIKSTEFVFFAVVLTLWVAMFVGLLITGAQVFAIGCGGMAVPLGISTLLALQETHHRYMSY